MTTDLQTLLESGEGYRLLVESVQDYAIFVLDRQGRVASWNPGAERLLRYREEEILGRDVHVFFTPEDIEKGAPEQELRGALVDGRASDDRWHVRQDGTYFFGMGLTFPLRDEQGNHRGFAKIMRDQTERKQMEEQLRSRAEALARADREKDEFLAVLAHELRNPLAPIFYALHLLEQAPTEVSQAYAIVERQVRRLARLVDDLLDVNRISTGKIELRREAVALRSLVEQAVETVRPIIESRRHELSISLPAEEIWLEADAARLEQVLTNLLNNAAKFTEDGGRISVTAERTESRVVVRVRDTGIGIAPDILPRVFDLFTQADRSLDRAQGGLGIGLMLARKLVELHGGTIAARSDGPGRGSELEIALPALPRPVPPPAGPAAASEAPRSLKILVVDDNDDTAEMMGLLLEMAGHQVRTAHTGPAALEAAAAHLPEVIVMDLGLPGLDGYQVAQRLRQDPAFREVMLIAASGYGQESDRRRSREAGFDHHLVKPVDPREIQEILASLAAGRS